VNVGLVISFAWMLMGQRAPTPECTYPPATHPFLELFTKCEHDFEGLGCQVKCVMGGLEMLKEDGTMKTDNHFINDLIEKFPLKKATKSHARKNAAGETVLTLPAKSSFQLVDGPTIWDFYCDNIDDSISWSKSFSNVLQAFELNKMLDEGLKDSGGTVQPSSSTVSISTGSGSSISSASGTPSTSSASGASPATPATPASGSIDQGFVIVSGTYGRLGHEKHSKDVTAVLRELVKQQGGSQLVLKAGPKKDVFGNPAEGKKKHLSIIFSCNGKMRRMTLKDNDPVNIDINS